MTTVDQSGFAARTRFDGKVVLVTGASSGLGAAMAVAFAEQGADIAICGRRVERLEQTAAGVERAGRRCVVVGADTSIPEDCERFAATAYDELGRIDVLVNNAGVGTAVPMTREKVDEFRSVIDVNLNGVYWMSQAAVRRMQPGSNIVNISSILGSWSAGLPQAAYSASKAALLGLTRDLAVQLTGRKGIRVTAIQPGYFITEMTEQQPGDFLTGIAEAAPAGRLGEVSELVDATIFLASDAAAYISGTSLVVDGGLTVR